MDLLRNARTILTLSLVSTVAAMAGAEAPSRRSAGRGEHQFRVRLGSAELIPERGHHASAAARGEAFLIQFDGLPVAVARYRLEKAGVDLLRYVGGGSYLARCLAGCGGDLASFPVRSTLDLTPAMKIGTPFRRDPRLRTRLDSQSPIDVVVRFFPWVPWEQARLTIEASGANSTTSRPGYRNAIAARIGPEALIFLLNSNDVAWIDPALPTTGPSLVNAAERSRVDRVRWNAEYLGVDGSGTKIGVLDWFADGIHTDFEDRVTPVNVRWNEDDHGVKASGCIAGAGLLEPHATGVAPGAELFWTSWVNDPWSALQSFHDDHGVSIVNNSWNAKPGWWLDTRSWHGDLWAFGYYHERAAAVDQLVRDTDLLVLFSAGNKTQASFLGPHTHGDHYGSEDGVWHEDLHPPNPRHSSIAGAAVAKNVLTIGGTTKEDNIVYFSSLGPTDDGRVKPDIVAVGLDVLTTAANDGYELDGGTSTSSSVVAGIASLLTEFWRRKHGRDPSSPALKNLLIHSARDLGNPGPDYHSGFGMADAELAAKVLDAAVFDDDEFRRGARRSAGRAGHMIRNGDATAKGGILLSQEVEMRSLVVETVLDQGGRSTYLLPVASGCEELRATLVWNDPPGPELVNDLDLRVVAPGGQVNYPFVLDPNRPTAAASQGTNRRDNVEQIRVHSPKAGRWRIIVDGKAVPDGPQQVALIASAGAGNRSPERILDGDLVIDEFFVTNDGPSDQEPGPRTVFRDNDPLNYYVEATILVNADYDDFFGSITMTTSVVNANGDPIVRFSTSGHGTGQGPLHFLLAVGHEIPAGLPAGSYTARAQLVMHNGARATADYQFTVEDPG